MNLDENVRTGLRFRFESGIDAELRDACLKFARWLRCEYAFPIRVPVYFKSGKRLQTLDGEKAVATFFEPISYSMEPYIRVATGDYAFLKEKDGKESAIKAILISVAHELTHYYQWINDLKLTSIGSERQATIYSYSVVEDYFLACKE